MLPRYNCIDLSKRELLCRWPTVIPEKVKAITHTKVICLTAFDLVACLRYHQGFFTAKRRSQLIAAKLPRVENRQRTAAKTSSSERSFGQKFLRIKNFVLWITELIAQMTSVVERLHRRSNEGRWMDRTRKIATRITVLHVTDNKANKVSRGRTTEFVTSRKVRCACSGRLVKRHSWVSNSTEGTDWFKDSLAYNKQTKHNFS